MGSSDPERRMRQLALLRAAYDAWPDSLGDRSAARHSRALLGRILIVLGGLPSGQGAPGYPRHEA